MSKTLKRKKVAIIGGGIAGLTAGYLIQKKHTVTLFEKSTRLGGNAYTHMSPKGDAMDIAVAAFGKNGYKNFYALLAELDISTSLCLNSFMSLVDMATHEGIYLTPTLKGSHMQKFQLFQKSRLKMLMQLYLGLRKAQSLLACGKTKGMSMEECIKKIPQFDGDVKTILICTLCLLSSMKASDILKSPANFFLNKLKIHNDVLSPRAIYSVRCVDGGTQSYVEALATSFRNRIVLGTSIQTVLRDAKGVTLVMKNGERQKFDQVVFACNADQILPLLDMPTPEEKKLLGSWKFYNGRVVVHRDYSAFPPRDLIQAYTFLYRKKGKTIDTSVNGAIWHQPNVSDDCEYIASQHPNFEIRDELIDLDVHLRTPIFDKTSYATLSKLPSLNGKKNSFFCGSYFGYGLHEDAVSSAVKVAKHFGVNFKANEATSKLLPTLKELFFK